MQKLTWRNIKMVKKTITTLAKNIPFPKPVHYRLVYWVHPEFGSDRKEEKTFLIKPTSTQIRALIRSRGSLITTDYKLTKL